MADSPDGHARKTTMAEVAEAAGVSQATVSLVLNNAGGVRVSEETRHRVQSVAQSLGYRMWHRSNAGRGSIQCIGLLIDSLESNPLAMGAIDAARRRAWANDCVLNVLPIQSNRRLERAAIDLLLSLRLVGVIYQSYLTRKVTLPKALRTERIILLNCYTDDNQVPHVQPNHHDGAHSAVRRLITAGHRRIGFINGSMETDAAHDRLQGYLQALREAGIGHDPALVRDGEWNMQIAERETAELLALPEPPTAIFCAADKMAVGCYEALKSRGLRVPEDMSVVGFDDDPMSRHLSPPLSTVHVPHAQMGRTAVDFLISRANGLPFELQSRMTCDFVSRASIAAPRR